jgi:hypothetical protein
MLEEKCRVHALQGIMGIDVNKKVMNIVYYLFFEDYIRSLA